VVENGVRKTYSARYYNPATGRFLSRDPDDGDSIDPKTLHKYLYVGGDPLNWVDPMGWSAEDEDIEIEVGVSTAEDKGLEAIAERVECILNTAADLLDLLSSGDAGSIVSLIIDLSACKAALKKVHKEVGGRLPKGEPGKFGSPQAGGPKKGYRMDPGHPGRTPGDPEGGPHFNWWDYSGGKRGNGGRSGSVPIG
jgi:RHS repeat-associated protein